MTLIQPIVYCTVALLSISSSPRGDDLADHFVLEQGDALIGRIGADGDSENLSDNSHYEKIQRNEGSSYVLLRSDDHRTWLTILECAADGALTRVRTVLDEKLDGATAIVNSKDLGDGRLFVVLHVNPTLNVAVTLDPRTSRRTVLLGNTFTWDKSGRHLAYLFDPSGSEQTNGPTELWVDGRKVCDAPTTEDGNLSWDESGARLTATFSQPGQKDVTIAIRVSEGVAVATTVE